MQSELDRVLRAHDDAAYALMERAISDDASVGDITAAAVAVREAGALRRKAGAGSQAHDDVEAEYLTGLHLRLLEIDKADDVMATAAAVMAITGKPVDLGGER